MISKIKIDFMCRIIEKKDFIKKDKKLVLSIELFKFSRKRFRPGYQKIWSDTLFVRKTNLDNRFLEIDSIYNNIICRHENFRSICRLTDY